MKPAFSLTTAIFVLILSCGVVAQITQPSTSPVQATAMQDGDGFFPYLYLSDAYMQGFDAGQAKEKIEKYTRVITRNEKYVLAAYNNRAAVYLQTGRSDLALADIEKALASKPKPEEASVLLGNKGFIFPKARPHE